MRPRYDIVYFPLGAAAFGGAERSLLELAAAQQSTGQSVLVCHEPALCGTDFIPQADALALPHRRIEWSPESSLMQVMAAAWHLFGELDARIVHFNISWRRNMWVVPVIARMRSAARLVGSMRAMPERYDLTPRKRHFGLVPGMQLWKLPDLLVGRVWGRTLHATVSVNRDDYPPRLREEFGFPAARLSVIYNGVRIAERAPSEDDRRQSRRRFGCPDDAFVVAYVGRVSQEKGVRYAVEALAHTPSHVHLLVAGEGNDLDALRAMATQLNLTHRVHFLGYQAQPLSVYAASHLVVVPSLWNEAFGRVVVEAMGNQVPVVATKVGGMQELFSDGVHGYFVPKGDTQAIAAAIGRLATDEMLREQMAKAARELAQDCYSTLRVAREYEALYAWVVHA